MKIVRARWRDAVAISAWTVFEAPPQPDLVETVGYLVNETPEHVIIAATISDGEYNAAMQILRVNLVGDVEDITTR